MFEFFIAAKYLIPKRKSLATALISLLSIIVISLVVWLILVFLSVTTGIEKNWIRKLTSLNAPIRITPTDKYYSSYFYRIDELASSSDYSLKNINEKAYADNSDPYQPNVDLSLPSFWPKAEYVKENKLLDPIKEAYNILNEKKIAFQDYEISSGLLRLTLKRENKDSSGIFIENKTSFLTQMSYLLSITENNPNIDALICPLSEEESSLLQNKLSLQDKNISPLSISLNAIEYKSYPIILPQSFRQSDVKVGDMGYLSYAATSSVSTQEQRLSVIVVGFYDPGILPVGNRFLLVPPFISKTINAATSTFCPEGTPINGLYVWFDNYKDADNIKNEIISSFEKAKIGSYWKVSTYKEFEFSRDLMQQFQSDRTLFTLIGVIILIVACSNIISLLVLLVNDKKKEIAILQAIGAKSKSIATIFGLCGVFMGIISTLIGTLAAIFTLHHLDYLVSFLSVIQGHNAFNAAFFGESLPNQLSFEALCFILIATPILSLAAGVIPAIKASKLRPSPILRAE